MVGLGGCLRLGWAVSLVGVLIFCFIYQVHDQFVEFILTKLPPPADFPRVVVRVQA
jgi:hypothetical protein